MDNIFLYKYRVIQILLDVLGHENKLDFDMDHFLHRVVFINEGFERFLTLTYFQHKVADYASVLRAVGEGKVFAWGRAVTDTIPFIPNTIPPYDVEYSEKIKQKLVELKANMASGPAGTLPRSRPGGPIKEKHDLEQAIRSAA